MKLKSICYIAICFIAATLYSCNSPVKEIELTPISSSVSVKKLCLDSTLLSSVFQFCTVVDAEEYRKLGQSHCVLYANTESSSYIILPKHSFSSDDKCNGVSLINSDGKKIEITESSLMSTEFRNIDLKLVEIKRLNRGTPLTDSRLQLDYNPMLGDSVFVLSPFNERGVKIKYATIAKNNSIIMTKLRCEPGDSGSLVIGKNGVIGMVVAVSSNNRDIALFIPVKDFEELYTAFAFPDK